MFYSLKNGSHYSYFVFRVYTCDNKEAKLNENWLLEAYIDIIISTSSIQNGQSIK